MRRVLLAGLVLVLLAPARADGARLTVSGGTPATIRMCGTEREAQLFDAGSAALLRASGRRRGRLVLERCVNGAWVDRLRIGLRRGRVQERAGDVRVRSVGKRRARAAYLRFGVGEIVDAAFTVTVQNVNGTAVPCMPDGAPRTLHGHLTAPRSRLEQTAPAVTLFIHGFAVDERFWRFRGVPGYDTTMLLAEAGHAAVSIDRAGYSTSKSAADGQTTCLGSQADMAHQVVEALKAGSYTVADNEPVAFARAALVGHSAGGLVAELAGASFGGIDGIGIVSYADQAQTPLAFTELGQQGLRCGTGGDAGTPGFALFGATPEMFKAAFLNAPTDPAVVEAQVPMHVPEPCGDALSAPQALVVANAINSTLTGPILLLSGEDDALFTAAGVSLQAQKYPGADTVTMEIIPDTGHAITTGRSAPTVVNALEGWLTTNEF